MHDRHDRPPAVCIADHDQAGVDRARTELAMQAYLSAELDCDASEDTEILGGNTAAVGALRISVGAMRKMWETVTPLR